MRAVVLPAVGRSLEVRDDHPEAGTGRDGGEIVDVGDRVSGPMPVGDQRRHLHVLPHGERAEEAEVLEGADDTEPGQFVGRLLPHVGSVEGDRSTVGGNEPGDDVDEGGLARTIGSDDPDDLAAHRLHTGIAQGRESAERDLDVVGLQP